MKLNLEWGLSTVEERVAFAKAYVEENEAALTPSNLDSISEYILWAADDPSIELTTQKSAWHGAKVHLSLDELQEQALETGRPLESLITDKQYAKKPNKLKREEVVSLLCADADVSMTMSYRDHPNLAFHPMTAQWVELWTTIDTFEYMVQTWEKVQGKRREGLPIREELYARLSYVAHNEGVSLEDLLATLDKRSSTWDAALYLKAKRSLVVHRQLQYQLLDALRGEQLAFQGRNGFYFEDRGEPLTQFYPFMDASLLIDNIEDCHFTSTFQNNLLVQLKYADGSVSNNRHSIRLNDASTIRALLQMEGELEKEVEGLSILDREVVAPLLHYFHYYVDKANLSPELILIKDMKVEGHKNREIAERLREDYGVEYKENYISTIYTKRIIDAIVEAVNAHVRLMEYLSMGKGVFKMCSRCKKLLPRNAEYFNKRSSTSDGYFPHCKECKGKKG